MNHDEENALTVRDPVLATALYLEEVPLIRTDVDDNGSFNWTFRRTARLDETVLAHVRGDHAHWAEFTAGFSLMMRKGKKARAEARRAVYSMESDANPVDTLKEWLAGREAGPIHHLRTLEDLLETAWSRFTVDGDGTGMTGYKMLGRIISAEWSPPKTLTFRIARHGKTNGGIHRWVIDLAAGFARYHPVMDRQHSGQEQVA